MRDQTSIVLQFGTGRFLRAFIEMFVQEINDAGSQSFSVVAVQSTPGPRATLINDSTEGYPVCVRGIEDGETIDRTCMVRSLSRALVAETEWSAVLEIACDPALKIVTSNTTEASYALDASDRLESSPPKSFPAKLTRCLFERYGKSLAGPTIAPCELVEHNGEVLKGLVLGQADAWNLDAAFVEWLTTECVWLNSMVDRMVVSPKDDDPLATNELCAVTEPFSLWVIERVGGNEVSFLEHPGIVWVDDVDSSFLRKVRILNGAHTAMVAKYLPLGYRTVRDVMHGAEARDWVRGLIFEEILPCIVHRTEDAAGFAFQTLDRLSNPFFEHRLADISMGHEAKVKIRLESSYEDFKGLYATEPARLKEAIAQKLP
jgi:tagaturonate reductase